MAGTAGDLWNGLSRFHKTCQAEGISASDGSTPVRFRTTSRRTAYLSSLLVHGDLAFQQNRYAEALRLYQKALKLRLEDRGVRRKVAVTLALLGRPESARPQQ